MATMNAVGKALSWIAVLSSATLSACDEGLQGLQAEAKALATLHVTLTGQLPPPAPDRPLRPRVSLVWAEARALEDPFCAPFAYGMPPPPTLTDLVERGCRDLLMEFLPRSVGDSVTLGPDAKADLPVYFLPAANDMQGDPAGRLAYASVVVFDDRNGNGALDLGRTVPQRGGSKGGGGGGGGGGQGGHGPPEGGGGPGAQVAAAPEAKSLNETDVLIAASWVSMKQPHVRVALREGDDVAKLRLFYPTPGCDPAPKFLSRFEVKGGLQVDLAKVMAAAQDKKAAVLDPLALLTPVECAAQPLDGAEVSLAVQATDVLASVRCRADEPFYREAEPQLNDNGEEEESPLAKTPAPAFYCLDANHLAIVNDGVCKGITHYFLRGCWGEYECPKNKKTGKTQKPEFDFSAPAKQPKWWPCGTPEPWEP
jgi:hypothetical protein